MNPDAWRGGMKKIAVIGIEGGAGKTTVTRCLDEVFATCNKPHELFDGLDLLSELSNNASFCCDVFLVPFTPGPYALACLKHLATKVHRRTHPYPLPEFLVFANLVRIYSGKPIKAEQFWIEEMRRLCASISESKSLDAQLLDTWIPRSASLSSAMTDCSIPMALKRSFRDLWREIEEKT